MGGEKEKRNERERRRDRMSVGKTFMCVWLPLLHLELLGAEGVCDVL